MNKIKKNTFVARATTPWLLALLVPVAITIMSLAVSVAGHGPHGARLMRWDIIHITSFSPVTVAYAGGVASAQANDGSKITLTGDGTFLIDPHGKHRKPKDVRGGGTWETFAPSAEGGGSTGNGTYEVTGFISFENAPGSPAPGTVDHIGDGTLADNRGGLAIFFIDYSDGEEGTLTVSCHLPGAGPPMTPETVFEGITATKGFVAYWNREAPLPGVDANRTLFHVLH